VVPWSEAAIGGFALERTLSTVQLTRLDAASAKLWPPGPYRPRHGGRQRVEAIVTHHAGRSACSRCSTANTACATAGLDAGAARRRRRARDRVPSLSTRERVLVETAARHVRPA
jgi:hypothetical protein